MPRCADHAFDVAHRRFLVCAAKRIEEGEDDDDEESDDANGASHKRPTATVVDRGRSRKPRTHHQWERKGAA